MKEDTLKHTMKQVNGDDVNVCFITAYEGDKTKEENDAANENLERDIRRLGYGFTKTIGGYVYHHKDTGENTVASEPGYKVAIRNPNPKSFIDEMLALGKRYNQWAVLIKVPGQKAAFYNTSNNVGQLDGTFDKAVEVNPQDVNSWKDNGGYTQLRKDVKKNPTKGFTMTNDQVDESCLMMEEEEIKALPEYTEKTEGRNLKHGNHFIVCHLLRKDLGVI